MELVGVVLLLVACCSILVSAEERPLFIVERRGNSSLECVKSGPCAACSLAEKQNEEIYHCSATGYSMPYQCVEVNEIKANSSASKKPLVDKEDGKSARKLEDEGRKILVLNKPCIPPVAEDKLTVVGFEGIMLGLLAIFSPILYYRKKRGLSVSGMSRIPTSSSARF